MLILNFKLQLHGVNVLTSLCIDFVFYFQTPLIASTVDFYKENIIAENTGLLCMPHDIDSLCNCLNIIIDKTFDRKRMQTNQQNYYTNSYSSVQLMKELETIYSNNEQIKNTHS